MSLKKVETGRAPEAIGPYSQGMLCPDDCVPFEISGQLPIKPGEKNLIVGDMDAMTHRSLQNLAGILEAAGGKVQDLAKVRVYLTDMDQFEHMNGAYGVFMEGHSPARACVEVSGLPMGAPIEIEAVAYIPKENIPPRYR
jgi:2-iminobutanoate/2-iminopropanoate deaminase